jgi:hypothetical protein
VAASARALFYRWCSRWTNRWVTEVPLLQTGENLLGESPVWRVTSAVLILQALLTPYTLLLTVKALCVLARAALKHRLLLPALVTY